MSPFEKHPQWPAVDKIHHTLVAKGYRALVAGGAVRDLLLGHTPNDIDIATNATPDQVGELFDKTVMVGKEFGVCRVVMEGVEIEVATFRKDGPYEDGRRPSSVEFSSDKEDALRRDFTINAMFYDLDKNEVIDY
ncbi:MAG: CCA tRNA nucleotidyltransferase, partial [Bdellovibrionales bacterium]|nr:CCA tRNA nucleotidyltransferase [Bdellovibrionales bacterium]